MSMRGRLTLWPTVIAAVVLVAGAVATYLTARHDLHGADLRHLRVELAIGCVAGTAVALVLSRLLARRTVRPLDELAATTAHVRATGNVTPRVHARRRDEVGRLAAEIDALLDALERARDAQRRLTTDAAHQLTAPVARLRASVEQSAQADGDIAARTRELDELVAELVELSRDGEMPLEPEDVRLDEIVREAVDAAPDTVRYETDLEPAALEGSPYRLGRAVQSLLDNADGHSARGGVVEVRLRGGELTVRDYGPGIPPDELPYVFDRFYRGANAQAARLGAGLGLAIVRQVATQHGGTIVAEHPPGGGALFRLRLPGARAPA